MSKPTYLGLLNSIAVNEAKGQVLLQTWADNTSDPQLRDTLEFVAVREGEHAWAFTKRICELGYAVDEEAAYQVFKNFDALVECAASDLTDADKVATLAGGNSAPAKDPFSGFFDDPNIDPQTGGLLGRYIAEERDSGRRLRAEYDRVSAAAPTTSNGSANENLGELQACIKSLTKEVASLRKKVKKLS